MPRYRAGSTALPCIARWRRRRIHPPVTPCSGHSSAGCRCRPRDGSGRPRPSSRLSRLTWLVVRESGATGAWQRVLAALLLLAMNQTGVVVGNGQLTFHGVGAPRCRIAADSSRLGNVARGPRGVGVRYLRDGEGDALGAVSVARRVCAVAWVGERALALAAPACAARGRGLRRPYRVRGVVPGREPGDAASRVARRDTDGVGPGLAITPTRARGSPPPASAA